MKIQKILDQSGRNNLKDKYQNHHLFHTHIESVLQMPYCYQMAISEDDYSKIWIHSCIDSAEDYPYQYLSSAPAYISRNKDFLRTVTKGCLDGQQVKTYMDLFAECVDTPQLCFENMDDCFVLDKGNVEVSRNEVTDGMHRLVAYGIVSNLRASYFPIPVILGTLLRPTYLVEID